MRRPILITLAACLACFLSMSGLGYAQILKDELPLNARGIDVEDRVGEFVPLDAVFTDERGNRIGLGKYFNHGKPIVLSLNYSDCPGLCIAQLDNLVATLRATGLDGMGDEYEIVTVSIDPSEDYSKAAGTKVKYTSMLGDNSKADAWHFLTGEQAQIHRLADAVGFRYTYDQVNKRYNHPAALYFISPNGRICRYLLSLGVEPRQFTLAVADANEGKLNLSVSDAIIQFCYLYDPDANRYSADARRILAFAAGAFCMLLLGATAPFWFSGRRKPKAADHVTAKHSPAHAADPAIASEPAAANFPERSGAALDRDSIEPSDPTVGDSFAYNEHCAVNHPPSSGATK